MTTENIVFIMVICIYFVLFTTFLVLFYRGQPGYKEQRAAVKRRKGHGSRR